MESSILKVYNFALMGLDTSEISSAIFIREVYCDVLFAFPEAKAIKILTFRIDPFSEGRKTSLTGLPPLKM